MPYIPKEKREPLDPLIAKLIQELEKLPIEKQDGALNYVVTKILRSVYPESYFHLNRAVGVLSAIQAEYFDKVVKPYEDKKLKENGDIEV